MLHEHKLHNLIRQALTVQRDGFPAKIVRPVLRRRPLPRRAQKLLNTHTVSQSWHTTLATRPLAVISCVMDMLSGASTGSTVHYGAVFMHKITEP